MESNLAMAGDFKGFNQGRDSRRLNEHDASAVDGDRMNGIVCPIGSPEGNPEHRATNRHRCAHSSGRSRPCQCDPPQLPGGWLKCFQDFSNVDLSHCSARPSARSSVMSMRYSDSIVSTSFAKVHWQSNAASVTAASLLPVLHTTEPAPAIHSGVPARRQVPPRKR